MFTEKDLKSIISSGKDPDNVKAQIERFRKGFPWMQIAAPATPGHGICVLEPEQADTAVAYFENAEINGITKFVPASGAASRMFKDLFAGLNQLKSGNALDPDSAAARFAEGIKGFAFYDAGLFNSPQAEDILSKTLTSEGLSYGNKPKGVLKFHRYSDGEVRTPFAEHLVEAQEYMRNLDGSANVVFTISPEHRALFEEELLRVKSDYESRYGVHYNISFTYQDKKTDTIAVDADNRPFRTDEGDLLFRPAGHGALIYNLNQVDADLVSIKNIDNVANASRLEITARWKKALMGKCLDLRDRIYAYLEELDIVTGSNIRMFEPYPPLPGYSPLKDDRCATDECQSLCNDIEEFLADELCITFPYQNDCTKRVKKIREILNRPIRVCGMVRNQGEPGGGPFIIRENDGSTSLQILESVQINGNDAQAVSALKSATHFNPVDIVCCLRNYQGEKFNLTDFVDEEAGFISSKSYQGRELKALELPGLWNGAMSRWNTMFVEVPLETFNPVKTVLDLLREAHQ